MTSTFAPDLTQSLSTLSTLPTTSLSSFSPQSPASTVSARSSLLISPIVHHALEPKIHQIPQVTRQQLYDQLRALRTKAEQARKVLEAIEHNARHPTSSSSSSSNSHGLTRSQAKDRLLRVLQRIDALKHKFRLNGAVLGQKMIKRGLSRHALSAPTTLSNGFAGSNLETNSQRYVDMLDHYEGLLSIIPWVTVHYINNPSIFQHELSRIAWVRGQTQNSTKQISHNINHQNLQPNQSQTASNVKKDDEMSIYFPYEDQSSVFDTQHNTNNDNNSSNPTNLSSNQQPQDPTQTTSPQCFVYSGSGFLHVRPDLLLAPTPKQLFEQKRDFLLDSTTQTNSTTQTTETTETNVMPQNASNLDQPTSLFENASPQQPRAQQLTQAQAVQTQPHRFASEYLLQQTQPDMTLGHNCPICFGACSCGYYDSFEQYRMDCEQYESSQHECLNYQQQDYQTAAFDPFLAQSDPSAIPNNLNHPNQINTSFNSPHTQDFQQNTPIHPIKPFESTSQSQSHFHNTMNDDNDDRPNGDTGLNFTLNPIPDTIPHQTPQITHPTSHLLINIDTHHTNAALHDNPNAHLMTSSGGGESAEHFSTPPQSPPYTPANANQKATNTRTATTSAQSTTNADATAQSQAETDAESLRAVSINPSFTVHKPQLFDPIAFAKTQEQRKLHRFQLQQQKTSQPRPQHLQQPLQQQGMNSNRSDDERENKDRVCNIFATYATPSSSQLNHIPKQFTTSDGLNKSIAFALANQSPNNEIELFFDNQRSPQKSSRSMSSSTPSSTQSYHIIVSGPEIGASAMFLDHSTHLALSIVPLADYILSTASCSPEMSIISNQTRLQSNQPLSSSSLHNLSSNPTATAPGTPYHPIFNPVRQQVRTLDHLSLLTQQIFHKHLPLPHPDPTFFPHPIHPAYNPLHDELHSETNNNNPNCNRPAPFPPLPHPHFHRPLSYVSQITHYLRSLHRRTLRLFISPHHASQIYAHQYPLPSLPPLTLPTDLAPWTKVDLKSSYEPDPFLLSPQTLRFANFLRQIATYYDRSLPPELQSTYVHPQRLDSAENAENEANSQLLSKMAKNPPHFSKGRLLNKNPITSVNNGDKLEQRIDSLANSPPSSTSPLSSSSATTTQHQLPFFHMFSPSYLFTPKELLFNPLFGVFACKSSLSYANSNTSLNTTGHFDFTVPSIPPTMNQSNTNPTRTTMKTPLTNHNPLLQSPTLSNSNQQIWLQAFNPSFAPTAPSARFTRAHLLYLLSAPSSLLKSLLATSFASDSLPSSGTINNEGNTNLTPSTAGNETDPSFLDFSNTSSSLLQSTSPPDLLAASARPSTQSNAPRSQSTILSTSSTSTQNTPSELNTDRVSSTLIIRAILRRKMKKQVSRLEFRTGVPHIHRISRLHTFQHVEPEIDKAVVMMVKEHPHFAQFTNHPIVKANGGIESVKQLWEVYLQLTGQHSTHSQSSYNNLSLNNPNQNSHPNFNTNGDNNNNSNSNGNSNNNNTGPLSPAHKYKTPSKYTPSSLHSLHSLHNLSTGSNNPNFNNTFTFTSTLTNSAANAHANSNVNANASGAVSFATPLHFNGNANTLNTNSNNNNSSTNHTALRPPSSTPTNSPSLPPKLLDLLSTTLETASTLYQSVQNNLTNIPTFRLTDDRDVQRYVSLSYLRSRFMTSNTNEVHTQLTSTKAMRANHYNLALLSMNYAGKYAYSHALPSTALFSDPSAHSAHFSHPAQISAHLSHSTQPPPSQTLSSTHTPSTSSLQTNAPIGITPTKNYNKIVPTTPAFPPLSAPNPPTPGISPNHPTTAAIPPHSHPTPTSAVNLINSPPHPTPTQSLLTLYSNLAQLTHPILNTQILQASSPLSHQPVHATQFLSTLTQIAPNFGPIVRRLQPPSVQRPYVQLNGQTENSTSKNTSSRSSTTMADSDHADLCNRDSMRNDRKLPSPNHIPVLDYSNNMARFHSIHPSLSTASRSSSSSHPTYPSFLTKITLTNQSHIEAVLSFASRTKSSVLPFSMLYSQLVEQYQAHQAMLRQRYHHIANLLSKGSWLISKCLPSPAIQQDLNQSHNHATYQQIHKNVASNANETRQHNANQPQLSNLSPTSPTTTATALANRSSSQFALPSITSPDHNPNSTHPPTHLTPNLTPMLQSLDVINHPDEAIRYDSSDLSVLSNFPISIPRRATQSSKHTPLNTPVQTPQHTPKLTPTHTPRMTPRLTPVGSPSQPKTTLLFNRARNTASTGPTTPTQHNSANTPRTASAFLWANSPNVSQNNTSMTGEDMFNMDQIDSQSPAHQQPTSSSPPNLTPSQIVQVSHSSASSGLNSTYNPASHSSSSLSSLRTTSQLRQSSLSRHRSGSLSISPNLAANPSINPSINPTNSNNSNNHNNTPITSPSGSPTLLLSSLTNLGSVLTHLNTSNVPNTSFQTPPPPGTYLSALHALHALNIPNLNNIINEDRFDQTRDANSTNNNADFAANSNQLPDLSFIDQLNGHSLAPPYSLTFYLTPMLKYQINNKYHQYNPAEAIYEFFKHSTLFPQVSTTYNEFDEYYQNLRQLDDILNQTLSSGDTSMGDDDLAHNDQYLTACHRNSTPSVQFEDNCIDSHTHRYYQAQLDPIDTFNTVASMFTSMAMHINSGLSYVSVPSQTAGISYLSSDWILTQPLSKPTAPPHVNPGTSSSASNPASQNSKLRDNPTSKLVSKSSSATTTAAISGTSNTSTPAPPPTIPDPVQINQQPLTSPLQVFEKNALSSLLASIPPTTPTSGSANVNAGWNTTASSTTPATNNTVTTTTLTTTSKSINKGLPTHSNTTADNNSTSPPLKISNPNPLPVRLINPPSSSIQSIFSLYTTYSNTQHPLPPPSLHTTPLTKPSPIDILSRLLNQSKLTTNTLLLSSYHQSLDNAQNAEALINYQRYQQQLHEQSQDHPFSSSLPIEASQTDLLYSSTSTAATKTSDAQNNPTLTEVPSLSFQLSPPFETRLTTYRSSNTANTRDCFENFHPEQYYSSQALQTYIGNAPSNLAHVYPISMYHYRAFEKLAHSLYEKTPPHVPGTNSPFSFSSYFSHISRNQTTGEDQLDPMSIPARLRQFQQINVRTPFASLPFVCRRALPIPLQRAQLQKYHVILWTQHYFALSREDPNLEKKKHLLDRKYRINTLSSSVNTAHRPSTKQPHDKSGGEPKVSKVGKAPRGDPDPAANSLDGSADVLSVSEQVRKDGNRMGEMRRIDEMNDVALVNRNIPPNAAERERERDHQNSRMTDATQHEPHRASKTQHQHQTGPDQVSSKTQLITGNNGTPQQLNSPNIATTGAPTTSNKHTSTHNTSTSQSTQQHQHQQSHLPPANKSSATPTSSSSKPPTSSSSTRHRSSQQQQPQQSQHPSQQTPPPPQQQQQQQQHRSTFSRTPMVLPTSMSGYANADLFCKNIGVVLHDYIRAHPEVLLSHEAGRTKLDSAPYILPSEFIHSIPPLATHQAAFIELYNNLRAQKKQIQIILNTYEKSWWSTVKRKISYVEDVEPVGEEWHYYKRLKTQLAYLLTMKERYEETTGILVPIPGAATSTPTTSHPSTPQSQNRSSSRTPQTSSSQSRSNTASQQQQQQQQQPQGPR